MKKMGSFYFLVLIALFSFNSAHAFCGEAQIGVMTFNIRNSMAKDGANDWKKRKDLVVQIIEDESPDIVGMQEAFYEQIEYLRKQLPQYEFVGIGRNGGKKGEFSPIFYKKDRFELVSSRTFWYSKTPQVQSKHWDSKFPRICTQAIFRDTRTSKIFSVFNSHFDHPQQSEARKYSALILAAEVLKTEMDSIMIGDFNETPSNPAAAILLGTMDQKEWKSYAQALSLMEWLVDFNGFQEAVMEKGSVEDQTGGTYHGFKGTPASQRIDYLFYWGNWTVLSAKTIRTFFEGRYPSDHFPVSAVFVAN